MSKNNNIKAVHIMIHKDKCLTTLFIHFEQVGNSHTILMFVDWRASISQKLLDTSVGEQFLETFVTLDETLVYAYDIETKAYYCSGGERIILNKKSQWKSFLEKFNPL